MPIEKAVLDELTRLKKQRDSYRPLSEIQTRQLSAITRYEHVWSSNAIEGNQLNEDEVTSILETGVTKQGSSVNDIFALVDLNAAYIYMQDLATRQQAVTQQLIQSLNRYVTTKTAADLETAGKYRTINVWPSGLENRPYVDPDDVRSQMTDLIAWAIAEREKLHPVVYAADLHEKFVAIHPFMDGNGRTARLLMNLVLIEAGYPVINIRPDEVSRNAYMDALEYARQTGDLTEFETIIVHYSKETLLTQIKTLALNEQNLRDAENDLKQ